MNYIITIKVESEIYFNMVMQQLIINPMVSEIMEIRKE